METLDNVFFYNLDKVTRLYRQFAQRNLTKAGLDITIDQWLVLKTIQENADISQQQLAKAVFKDVASVTRIIDLLVTKEFLFRKEHQEDRRRFALAITKKGMEMLRLVSPLSASNRKKALEAVTDKEIQAAQKILKKIIDNIS